LVASHAESSSKGPRPYTWRDKKGNKTGGVGKNRGPHRSQGWAASFMRAHILAPSRTRS